MKVQEVGAFEAKTHLSALLEKVRQGETIYITKHGKRVAELRPVESPKGERVPGTMKGQIWMSPDFDEPLEDFKDYM